jgi:hypothetical protein
MELTRRRLAAVATVVVFGGLGFAAFDAAAVTHPSRDVSDGSFDASLPRLAGDSGGAVAVLWTEQRGDDSLVYAATMDAGDHSLGPPARLSDPGASALDARVAVGANGDTLAIWDRSDGAHQVVQSATRLAGQNWGPALSVSAAGADAYRPRIALGETGLAVAVWSRSTGTSNVIQASLLPARGTWGTAVDLTTPSNVTRDPQVAIGGDGTAVAVWQRSAGDYSAVQASVLIHGVWSPAVTLSVPGQNASTPRVAMDDAGDAVAIWRWFDGANWIVASSFRPADGTWQRIEPVSVAGFSAQSPQLAMNGAGQAVAVWAYGSSVWSSQLGAGGRWSAERQVDGPDSPSGTRSSAPSVAISATGDETAVWVPNGNVYGSFKRHDADAWDQDQQIDCNGGSDDTCFYPYQSHVVVDGSGTAVAVFMESRDHETLTSALFDDTQPPAAGDSGDDSGNGDSGNASSSDSLAITGGAGTGTILDRTAALLPGKRIRVTVGCEDSRPCRGHLILRNRSAHVPLAGSPLRIAARRTQTIVLRLTGVPATVLSKGARLRVQISIQRVRRGRLVVESHAFVIIGRHESHPRRLVVRRDRSRVPAFAWRCRTEAHAAVHRCQRRSTSQANR